jgi:hypothetical protein
MTRLFAGVHFSALTGVTAYLIIITKVYIFVNRFIRRPSAFLPADRHHRTARFQGLTTCSHTVYYWCMSQALYLQLQETANRVARSLSRPLFYSRHDEAVRRSEEMLRDNELIRKCHALLDESQLECAHGVCHCEAVARDAGAIVLIEGNRLGIDRKAVEPLFVSAIIAGLLHDIKRREEDHAIRGSIEAEKILTTLGMDERSRSHVAYAIRNHEAFKAVCNLDDEAGCMVSDALYDADKFRWGPENFSTTLWLMVTAHNTPLEALHRTFREKMKGIEKIKETFRTATGRQYGPEFIDQGITIGNTIYEEMSSMLRQGS